MQVRTTFIVKCDNNLFTLFETLDKRFFISGNPIKEISEGEAKCLIAMTRKSMVEPKWNNEELYKRQIQANEVFNRATK